MLHRTARAAALLGLACVLAGCGCCTSCRDGQPVPATRPAAWAQPLTVAGVPNLHRVSRDLYRGAQPTDQGLAHLKALGIRTIVNLRTWHSEADACRRLGLDYVEIHCQAYNPETPDVVAFLKAVTDPARQPVFFHCRRGADRTGMMLAAYRVCVQGWSKFDAIQEMVHGGYEHDAIWSGLRAYIEKMDVEAVRREAGLVQNAARTPRLAESR